MGIVPGFVSDWRTSKERGLQDHVTKISGLIFLMLTLTANATDLTAAKTDDVPSGNVVVSVPIGYLGSPTLFRMGFSISIPSMAPVKDLRHNDFREQQARRDDGRLETQDRVMVVELCHYTDAQTVTETCRGDDPDRAILLSLDSERWPESKSPNSSISSDPEVIALTTGDQPLIRVFTHSNLPKASDSVFGRYDCSDGVCQVHYFYECPSGPPYPPFRICHGPFQDRQTGIRGELQFIHVDPNTADKIIEATITLLRSWTHPRG